MKNTILTLLILSSLAGFGQSKSKLPGTIWATEAEWSQKDQDSIYYSITFKEKTAVLKCKYKTLARTRFIEELSWEHDKYQIALGNDLFRNGDDNKSKISFSKSWYTRTVPIEDNSFSFTQFGVIVNKDGSAQTSDEVGEVRWHTFHLKTDNSLNGTVWVNPIGCNNDRYNNCVVIW